MRSNLRLLLLSGLLVALGLDMFALVRAMRSGPGSGQDADATPSRAP